MRAIESGYARLIQNLVAFAQNEQEIRAVLMIGSRARTDHPADEWSDLDLLVFATEPKKYVRSGDWVKQIGVPLLTFTEQTPGGDWERRTLFEGGLDVDFAISSTQGLEYIAHNPFPADVVDLLRRGTRVLIDKDGLLALVQKQPLPPTVAKPPPGEAEFLNVVNDFWYHALWTAKHLRRGELWWSKSGLDMRLKELLRKMLEWHAQATHPAGFDTWLRGRFLEEWADPRALAALPLVFAHYDTEDMARALLATMDLFQWMEQETAKGFQYDGLTAGEQAVTQEVRELLAYNAG